MQLYESTGDALPAAAKTVKQLDANFWDEAGGYYVWYTTWSC